MIIMGDLSGNRLRLAEGIIEHVAAFAPSIENTQRFSKPRAKFHILELVAGMSSPFSAPLLLLKVP